VVDRRRLRVLEASVRHDAEADRVIRDPRRRKSEARHDLFEQRVRPGRGVEQLPQPADAREQLVLGETVLRLAGVALAQLLPQAAARLTHQSARGVGWRKVEDRSLIKGVEQLARGGGAVVTDGAHSGLRARRMQRGESSVSGSPWTPPKNRASAK